jgi:hypothetical protein
MVDDRLGRGLLTSEQRKWWTLAPVLCGLFMIILDATVVNRSGSPWRESR